LSQAAQLDWAQPAVLLFPVVEGGFTDAQLAADFRHRNTGLGLLQRKHDLRFREL
jgi:hypothetical protein